MAAENVDYIRTILDFLGAQYGNIASVIGLGIALEGFRRTLIGVREAKDAADAAKREASDAVARVGSQILLNELTVSIRLLEEHIALNRSRNWERSLDRCEQLRSVLSRMIEHTQLSNDDRFKVASGIDDLRDILAYIERISRTDSNKSLTQTMQSGLHELLVTLNRISGKLRNLSLEAKNV